MEQIIPTLSLYSPDLVGVLIPPIVEILNKDIPEEKATKRFLVSILVCFIAAMILRWDQLMAGSATQLLTSFGLIFTESQVVYRLYFKDSFIRHKLQERLSVDKQGIVG